MSLVKKPQMTEKRLAALEKMREKAHGPATAEGRVRIRAGHLHAQMMRMGRHDLHMGKFESDAVSQDVAEKKGS